MMLVEFFGLPGCGKSSLVAELVKLGNGYLKKEHAVHLGWRRYLASSHWRVKYHAKIPYSIACRVGIERLLCARKPKLLSKNSAPEHEILFNNVHHAIGSMQTPLSDRYWLLDRVREHFADEFLINLANIEEKVLLDEHFCQTALSLYAIRNLNYDWNQLAEYVFSMKLPHKAVFVRAPIEVCFDRLKARRRGVQRIWRDLSDEQLMDALARTEEVATKMCSLFNERGLKVISIDNRGDLIDVTHELQRELEE